MSTPGERVAAPDRAAQWAAVTRALADALGGGWRAGATALWAAGRRREAVWLRAEYRAAAAVLASAGGERDADAVARTVRRCRTRAAASAAHPLLAQPWREAARVLAVAGRVEARRAAGLRSARGRGAAGGAPLAAGRPAAEPVALSARPNLLAGRP